MTHLEELNLNGNNFDSLQEVVIALTTLPMLKNLHINLHEEEQVDFIFRTLPNLMYLNDTEVEREEVSGIEEEEEEKEGEMEIEEPAQSMERGSEGEDEEEVLENPDITPQELEAIAVLYD